MEPGKRQKKPIPDKPISFDKITRKQAKILNTVSTKPELTTREVAKLCDTDHSHVVRVMQRYGIVNNYVHDYKANRADIFAGLQHILLSSITPDDIQKAPLGSRVLAACQIYDKERLERGQSTGNMAVGLSLTPALQDAVNHIINRNCVPQSDPIKGDKP